MSRPGEHGIASGDGVSLHERLAARVVARPRRVDLGEIRDFTLIAVLAVAAPLPLLALAVRAPAVLTAVLASIAIGAAAQIGWIARRDHGLGRLAWSVLGPSTRRGAVRPAAALMPLSGHHGNVMNRSVRRSRSLPILRHSR